MRVIFVCTGILFQLGHECLQIFKAETVESSLLDVMCVLRRRKWRRKWKRGQSQSSLLWVIWLTGYRAWLRAECLVGHTGQVLAPAWPGAGGGHWVKALDETGPPSLGLWSGPEGLVVLLTVTTAETLSPAALAPTFLKYKKRKKKQH